MEGTPARSTVCEYNPPPTKEMIYESSTNAKEIRMVAALWGESISFDVIL